MPRFTLRFIGMSLFVRHPNDQKVDVRFTTAAHGSAAGHAHNSAEDQHVPVLMMSPDSWDRTNESGNQFPGRAPGRPIYLSQFDAVDIFVGNGPLAGPVNVSNSGPVTQRPTTDSEWNNFQHLIPHLDEIFPGGQFTADGADEIAPTGKMTLNGGQLTTEPPSHPKGEGPWDVVDADSQTVLTTRFLTDVATYTFEFDASTPVQINLRQSAADDLILAFRPNRDIFGWVVHEPFIAALKPIKSDEVLHLAAAGGFVTPAGIRPRILRTSAAAPFLHPDDRTCPPSQVQL